MKLCTCCEKCLAWKKARAYDPEKQRAYRDAHKQLRRQQENKYYTRFRTEVLLIIGRGKLICNRCGTTSNLEINHIYGGGTKEGQNKKLMRDVKAGRRSIDDLELLCHPCNIRHAVELGLYSGPRPRKQIPSEIDVAA